MAYSEAAKEQRRCKATRADGEPCRAWARWGTDTCSAHTFEKRGRQAAPWATMRARYEPCTCAAYAWPHRPGGGLCRWPEPPQWRSTIPASTHAWWRPGRYFAYHGGAGGLSDSTRNLHTPGNRSFLRLLKWIEG